MTTTQIIFFFACFIAVSYAGINSGWTIAVGQTYFPDCSAQPSSYCKRDNCNIWYVDPVGGSVDGDGTSAKPWINMTYALNNIRAKTMTTSAKAPYTGPIPIPSDYYNSMKDLHPNGVIMPGDVIVLRTGNYPMLTISNYYVDIPITIMGEPGGRPVIDRLALTGTGNFVIACLNFTTTDTSNVENFVVFIQPIGYLGAAAYGNVFTKNTIFCYPDINVFKGRPQGDLFKASIGAFGTRDALYTEVSYNYLYNIKRGFSGMSAYTTYKYNVINYFIGDGFRVLQNNTIVEHNLVMNSMNVDNNQDHRDGVQFFTNGNAWTLTDIIIRNNVFIADLDKSRPFFSGFQGISGFDVMLNNVTVENNLVTTIWNWHGISLWKGQNCKIIGNTVLDVSGNRTFYPWISTNMGAFGNIIQNNIAHAATDLDGVANMNSNLFKQWTMKELEDLFVDPHNFNLRLKDNGSNPFIGTGNSTNAPVFDNDGNLRGGDYDKGCYAFQPLDPSTYKPPQGDSNNPGSNTPGSITPSSFSHGISMTRGNGSLAAAVIGLIVSFVLYF